ncbi:MAG: ABC transporter substrate binding protein, partial [Acidaminococcaceae bacterium]
MKKLVAAKGLTLQEATVSTVNDIQQAGQSLALAQVDAIYVPTDNVVASAMPVLATITNEAKIPVICGEAEVVKNGALATIGIDYYKLGLQTGAMAAKILSG